MLMGVDFMIRHGVSINLPEAKIVIGDEEVPMVVEHAQDQPIVSRVTVQERIIIPPNSVKLIPCRGPTDAMFMLEPNMELPAIYPGHCVLGHIKYRYVQ